MNDSELLQYIRKLIEEKSETLQGRNAWQEHLDRHTTVSAKSIQASEIIRGFSGSWASVYSSFYNDERLEKIADQRTPPNPSKEFSKIGQSGVPEINFAPYDHNTNRQGMKGTSLIGHPISFEVIGTTVKSSACDWQFIAEDNSATPTQGDTLKIDYESSLLSPNVQTSPTVNNWQFAYGLGGSKPIPHSGLYVVVSHTGEPPPIIDGTNPCGLGDGFIAQSGVAPTFDPAKPRQAVRAKGQYSKYEIFRVVDVEPDNIGGLLTLDTGKRLADFFQFDNEKSNIIRSITLITPKVTRLATIPNSGPLGSERAFVVVPPETSSNSDLMPPLNGFTAGDGTWVQGGFDLNDPTLTGNALHYSDVNKLPIPRVLGEYTAQLEKESQGLVQSANLVRLHGTFGSEIKIGQIIHIFKKEIDLPLDIPLTADPFGWYEIKAKSVNVLALKKLTEVNPETGVKNYRPVLVKDNADVSFVGLTYTVTFHLHDPISVLHSENFDIDAVEHARLDNLIDPTWVEESGRNQESGQNTLYSKSDRAIFNTQSINNGAVGSNADPGSLLDLGFRMVLFPAIEVAGEILPDFNNPITSRECVLDPLIDDKEQYIHIDYSNGLVLLSHEPKWKTITFAIRGSAVTNHKTDINPNFVTDDKGRLVLFASCVPYSRELGQLGSAIRVTASTVDFTNDLEEQNDIYGKRISFDIQAGQTVISQAYNSQVILSTLDSDNLLPESGYIEILHSASAIGKSNEPAFSVFDGSGNNRRVSTFIYHKKGSITSGGVEYTTLIGVVGGGSTGSSITTVADGDFKVILRKNVRPLCDDKGVCGVPYQEDTTHGSAKRFGTIRFKNSDIIQNKDGSVTIDVGVSPPEDGSGEELIELEGEFLLLPKGPTTSNGSGESRWIDHTTAPHIFNLNTYPTDTPLYEFSGGYGKGFLRRGYPIKPSGYFNINTGVVTYTPPSEVPAILDTADLYSAPFLKKDIGINSGVASGNLSVGYRHINSRESSVYSSQLRMLGVSSTRGTHQTAFYRSSMVRQMRVLEGMVIEDVTNGTFFTVGSKGMIATDGFTKRTTISINDSVSNVADGDTIYVSSGIAGKKVEFVFKNTPSVTVPEEILIGSDTYHSLCNLVLKGNQHPDMESNNITFDLERSVQDIFLHTYYDELSSNVSSTVSSAYGLVYNNPVDQNGYYGVGGLIVGATGEPAPTIQKEFLPVHTDTDTYLSTIGLLTNTMPNHTVSSGDRASLFWTFYDPTKTATLNPKDRLFIGYLDFDDTTAYEIEVSPVWGSAPSLRVGLEAVVQEINSLTDNDYFTGTPTPFPSSANFKGVEARLCHIEEGTAHNRYVLEIRSEVIGTNGNRWFISGRSSIGAMGGIISLVSKKFENNLDVTNATWTNYAQLAGGTYDYHNLGGSVGMVWFFDGGKECEINYDFHSHLNTKRLANQSGTGDRTDNDIPRKPLAGHHYRIVPNVEFVPILGEQGLNGGLLSPFTDPSNPTTVILDAHAIFYDLRYNFKSTDIGKKLYICGTDTYAYVGWWEILGILPNYSIPQNIESPPLTVAIVKKHKAENRSQTNDERVYSLLRRTDRGQLPITYRSPIVRMGFDVLTNGQGGLDNHEPYGFFKYWDKVNTADASYTDLALTVQLAINGSANKVQQFVVPKYELASGTLFGLAADPNYVVYDAQSLAKFCNADERMNGSRIQFSDGSTGKSFINWVVETDSEYSNGSALYVLYDLQFLNLVQKESMVGVDGLLQINFLSRQDGMFFKDDPSTYGPPSGLNDPSAIGFISYPGHNAEFDTCLGDRNSAFAVNPFEILDGASNPFAQPSPIAAVVKSACNGLRWVISEPLTDEYNGSYVHLRRQNDFLFNGVAWNSFPAIKIGDENPIIECQDTFRINKCPTTKQFLLGGDVEVFHTEVNGIIDENHSSTVPIYRHPIAYSSLGVTGVWKDTETGVLPNTNSGNYKPTYKLQRVNKERIITVSPSSMTSNSLLGSQTGSVAVGTGGLSTRIIVTSTPQMVLSAESPFKLFSKSNIQRSSIWGVDAVGANFGSNADNTRTERELWNSDNIFGRDLTRTPKEIPHYYLSLYSWSPNSEWWQLQMPRIQENDQINASTPPPTLRVDLTDHFTQSLVRGNTDPKGIRLNKLWVNFGVWGDISDYTNPTSVAGAAQSIVGLSTVLSKPQPIADFVTLVNHIAFNLIVEIPQRQTKKFNKEKNRGIITVKNGVAEADLGNILIVTSTSLSLFAVSVNDSSGNANTIADYAVVVGQYLFDSSSGTYVWTPFDEQKLARSISDALNIIYKNPDLSPSAENTDIQAQALYNKIYWESPSDCVPIPLIACNCFEMYFYDPNTSVGRQPQTTFTNSGSDSLLFGDRGSTATSTHLMDIDTLRPIKTIVVPLYVNREGGELMPNVMEQQVDIGVGKYSEKNANISADWNNGDPNYGFGFGDYPNYLKINSYSYTDNVTKSPYQLMVTNTNSYSKYSLIGNPTVPVVWGGIDFDSANNNYIQKSSSDYEKSIRDSALSINGNTHNGWNGQFTAPFSFTGNSIVQSSTSPRLSRLSGGLRGEFSSNNIVNGDILSREGSRYPYEGPASLSANAMTGIVIAHKAPSPAVGFTQEGATVSSTAATPDIGTNPIRVRNSYTCPHSFTIALTPMAQKFSPPTDARGRRSSVGTAGGQRTNPEITERLSDFGRYLDPDNPQNLVGNWLGEILSWTGIENSDGSTLPQGARVYLEVSTNHGGIDGGSSNNGVWVGSVKCSFDVETDFGTTQNKLIDEE